MKGPKGHEVQAFEDGEVVVREGEETREMFIIREGRIEILKQVGGHEVRLAVLERGSFFGEMSLLEGLPRSATARAIGKTELVVLRPGSLLVQIRRDPTFAFELLQQMSGRIRATNERLLALREKRHETGAIEQIVRSGEYTPSGGVEPVKTG